MPAAREVRLAGEGVHRQQLDGRDAEVGAGARRDAGWASPAYVPRSSSGTSGCSVGLVAHVRLVDHASRCGSGSAGGRPPSRSASSTTTQRGTCAPAVEVGAQVAVAAPGRRRRRGRRPPDPRSPRPRWRGRRGRAAAWRGCAAGRRRGPTRRRPARCSAGRTPCPATKPNHQPWARSTRGTRRSVGPRCRPARRGRSRPRRRARRRPRRRHRPRRG